MKKLIILIIAVFSVFNGFSQKSKYFLEITFKEGDFKGTHVFTPEKGNYASQINLEFHKGVSNLNASKLVSEKGIQIHYFTKHFLGEATKGIHQSKKYTSGCGNLNFIDLKNNQPYKRINGDFIGCTETKITKVGGWKKSYIKSRREISGSFSDTVSFEYRMDNGSKKVLTTEVTVKFTVRESRRI